MVRYTPIGGPHVRLPSSAVLNAHPEATATNAPKPDQIDERRPRRAKYPFRIRIDHSLGLSMRLQVARLVPGSH
jgi:hypothetical protein